MNKQALNEALLEAATKGTPSLVEKLLGEGAEANTKTKFGLTPLHVAALGNENPAVIEALIASGADANALNEDEAWDFSWRNPKRHARMNDILRRMKPEETVADTECLSELQ